MPIIIILILIVGWMYISDKMKRKLRNGIVILVDLVALITFCIVQSSAVNRIILVIVLSFAGVFWIAKHNRGKSIYMPVNLKEIKNLHIPDLFFSLGVMTIVYILLL